MSRVTKSLQFVKGRRIRVTRLDNCGRPVIGDESQAVSSGFVSVGFTPNTSETEEINVLNAAGESCVYEASVQSLLGYGIEIVFCNVDPDILSIMTGQPVVLDTDGSTIIGIDIDTKISTGDVNFAFELWMGVPSGKGCDPGATGDYGYLVLPFVGGGILSDFSVENGAVTFTLTGANTKDGNAWGVGPYDITMTTASTPAPSKLPSPLSTTTALRLIRVRMAPPPAAVGARPLMDASRPALTSITASKDTTDASGQTAKFVTSPVAVGPVWYDFGDGTWDYVAAPGATNHKYAKPGTYTVRATQNGAWVTASVTVPYT